MGRGVGDERKLDLFTVTLRVDELIGQGKEEREAAEQKVGGEGGKGEGEGEGEGWEGTVDELVDWAAELDFDAYQHSWGQAGITSTAAGRGSA